MSLLRRVGIVSAASLGANAAALVRNAAVAARFGTGPSADLIAYGEAVLLFLPTLLLVRECYALFISVYGGVLEDSGREEAQRLSVAGLRTVLLAGGVLAVLLVLLPGTILRLVAPGLSPEQAATGARLLRWISPALLLQEVTEYSRSVQNAHHRYAVPGAVVLVGNIFQATILILMPAGTAMLSWVMALNGAVLLQAVIMIVLFPNLRTARLLGTPWHPEFRAIGRRLAPVALGVLLVQLAGYVERASLSFMPPGSMATLVYSRKLIAPLQVVLAASVALPIYVQMSRAGSRGADLRAGTFLRGLQIDVFLFVPLTVFILLFAPEIVKLAFQRGLFGHQGVVATTPLLRIGVLIVLPASLLLLLRDFFYTLGNTRPLVLGGAIQLALGAIANLVLAPRYGLAWVPAGVVAGTWTTCFVLLFVIRRSIPRDVWNDAGRAVVIAVASGLGAAAAGAGALSLIGRSAGDSWIRATLVLLAGGASGFAAYCALACALGHPLARNMLGRLRTRASA